MNDSFDRNLVVIIFLIAFFYLNFLSLQIRSKSGWTNTTCNPISLFSNSIFQSNEDANKDFEKCVVHLSAVTTTNMFKKQRTDQEKVVAKMSSIESKYDKLSNHVGDYTKEVKNVVDDYKNEIGKVKDTQNNANTLNKTTTSKIDFFIGEITKIFENITTYFK